jgi:AcrR family transcriptional regulator
VLGTPTRDRKAERRAEPRRAILQTAWDVAREVGLNQLTLRDVATRVGMRPPSLYTHFESKMAIYDAMYAEAWAGYAATVPELESRLPEHPREALHALALHFYDYATEDLPRHQLMSQRIIPGFEPTPESYEAAVRVLEHGRKVVSGLGTITPDDFDVWVALIAGLINQHHANDPGGSHYRRLLRRSVDMWADAVGLPPAPRRTTARKGRPS